MTEKLQTIIPYTRRANAKKKKEENSQKLRTNDDKTSKNNKRNSKLYRETVNLIFSRFMISSPFSLCFIYFFYVFRFNTLLTITREFFKKLLLFYIFFVYSFLSLAFFLLSLPLVFVFKSGYGGGTIMK